jgi:hypothetical protein
MIHSQKSDLANGHLRIRILLILFHVRTKTQPDFGEVVVVLGKLTRRALSKTNNSLIKLNLKTLFLPE